MSNVAGTKKTLEVGAFDWSLLEPNLISPNLHFKARFVPRLLTKLQQPNGRQPNGSMMQNQSSQCKQCAIEHQLYYTTQWKRLSLLGTAAANGDESA